MAPKTNTKKMAEGKTDRKLNPVQQHIEELHDSGMKLTDIAVAVGVSMFTVSRWRSGAQYPHPVLAGRLLDVKPKQ